MKNTQKTETKAKLEAFNKAQEKVEKHKLIDTNSLPFDSDCAELIVENTAHKIISIRIFNSLESLTIGCLVVPNKFENTNKRKQFIAEMEAVRNQYKTLLLISEDSNFTDFGFKEMPSSDATNTHYRNSSFDFENFRELFKNCPTVFMKTTVASGQDSAMEAIIPVFKFPDFIKNDPSNLGTSLLCISSGIRTYSKYEVNDIIKYSLNQITRGMSLSHSTIEDLSLGNTTRISVFIGINTITE
ncbi:cell division GTPase FtsZ [Flavobacterium sp. 7E]|uniref:hypothetical protein n=1 Tax=Flavobacterium sp. 7E TaxID=2735898 RepID=UPI00156FEC37|nr:hypothetical protein [Flavobacterium sp. 7E]NRS87456.1 cell division GTPase FtsZ [Flavobacterium sp. 7E]